MTGEDEPKTDWWRQKRWWIPGLLVVGGLLVLIIVGPPALIRASRSDIERASAADQLKAENDLRGTLVTMLAGVALAAGTVVAALNFANSRAGLAETQRQNRESSELQRRGQVTERFSKAIDQLGERGDEEHEKPDVRLGGVYALEQIARDSPDLHWPIVEILTAFIREHTEADAGAEPTSEQLKGDKGAPSRNVAADIQAALTVLGRRDLNNDRGQVNLSGAKLQRASLSEANLQRADLGGANLQDANLRLADLQGANLWHANLQGADLGEANLQDAKLVGANLHSGNILGSNLQGASLNGANLQGAFLTKANLQAADLRGAKLQNALLSGANLQDANLAGLDSYGQHPWRTALQGVFLVEADLRGAILTGANLQGAYLTGANLQRADLRAANLQAAIGLTQEQLDSAYCDKKTKLPPGLTIDPKAGPRDERSGAEPDTSAHQDD